MEGPITGAPPIWPMTLISLRRFARSKFMLSSAIMAGVPVFLTGAAALVGDGPDSIVEAHTAFEVAVRFLYLPFIVFIIANVFGFAIMRQEQDDQTLHYLMLQPAPPWTIIVGKFVAFLILVGALIQVSFWTSYLLLTVPYFGPARVMEELFVHGRMAIMVKESAVLMLALVAYGAFAMLMGCIFKSAFYIVLLMFWEWLLPYMPVSFKFWTIVHYLHSLLPIRLEGQRQLFELLGEPAGVGFSLTVIVVLSATLLATSAFVFGRKECLYSAA